MRRWNARISAAILVLLVLHVIAGSFQLWGLLPGGKLWLTVLAWTMTALIGVHAVIGCILTAQTLRAVKRSGVQYFRENRQLMNGLPTVAWCASELAYSPRYFGDIVHKATGGTAIGYIHNYIINQAKSLLMQGHNISETSRLLGFDFPHHFTRLFKRITGLTPSEFVGR